MKAAPSDELLWKLQKEHNWGVDEWEVWWCRRFHGEPGWSQMKRCDKCNCERRD